MYNAQAVVFGNKVYIGGGSVYSQSKLLVYEFTKDLWDTLSTHTQWFALTTYHSQLVLIGGRDATTWKTTNELWVLDEECQWIQPLPAMTTKCYQASAVSVGDNLIVAGGCSSAGDPLDIVEVYNGHMWRQVQSLPRACSSMKSAVLEGNWYLASRTRQGRKVYHTSLESLIATSEEAGQTSVWKMLPDAPLQWSTLAVLSNQLVTVGGAWGGYNCNSAIYAYTHNTNTWVHVGDLPVACYLPCSLALPTGELLVVTGTRSGLFRASVGGHLHDVFACINFVIVTFIGTSFSVQNAKKQEYYPV